MRQLIATTGGSMCLSCGAQSSIVNSAPRIGSLSARNRGLERLHDVLDEARSFLSLPRAEPPSNGYRRQPPAQIGSSESARRLFAMSQRISGTIAEAYLRNRGISALHDVATLRFHPRCYYRPDADAPTDVWPALVAAVTNLSGSMTGAHRTWPDSLVGG